MIHPHYVLPHGVGEWMMVLGFMGILFAVLLCSNDNDKGGFGW